jgi:cobalt-zinc-cadmium efflux system outer membrane protein
MFGRIWIRRWPCALLLAVATASAQDSRSPGASAPVVRVGAPAVAGASALGPSLRLREVFEAAWQRRPEAQSLEARQEAASARRRAADSWTAEPPALELSTKTDRANDNQGAREHEVGVALPLWLPGEKTRSAALADAEERATSSRALAAKLQTAATVREAYWTWQRARIEHELARDRLANVRQLAADVARRLKAGDLAQADHHQAQGAVAVAESSLAQSMSSLAAAAQQLRALAGMVFNVSSAGAETQVASDPAAHAEPMPPIPPAFERLDEQHGAAMAFLDRAQVAHRAVDLARVQKRGNPELTLSTTRERSAIGQPYQQSVMLGVRIPFGSDARNRAKVAAANADAIEAQSELQLKREQLLAELETARVRVDSSRLQLEAAAKRERLARESLGFFEKSFRLGETDLPTRLRIELEAVEAGRQAARARIDLAASISALRQAMGLLPE